MQDDNSDIFTSEFRTEEVKRFVKGLIDGSIKLLSLSTDLNPEVKRQVIIDHTELLADIERYVSGKLRGTEFDTTESRIFSRLARMRLSQVIDETVSQTQIEDNLQDLRSRLDSTNRLLMEISAILRQVLEKLGI